MDVLVERALTLAGRRPGHTVLLSELAAELNRELPGFVAREEQLALRLARHPSDLHIVRLGHTVWDTCAAWPDPIRDRYLAAFRAAAGGKTAYVVALRPPATAQPDTRSRAYTLQLLDATVAGLAPHLDNAGPMAAAHWQRMTRETQKVHHALRTETCHSGSEPQASTTEHAAPTESGATTPQDTSGASGRRHGMTSPLS